MPDLVLKYKRLPFIYTCPIAYYKHLQITCVHCRHASYRAAASASDTDSTQRHVSTFFTTSHTTKYATSHSQQKAITKALVDDLIINCSLPLAFVEHPNFRHFMSIVDNRYTLPARSTVTSRVTQQADQVKLDVIANLGKAKTVNLTLDIWSDRRMRAYLGITGHYIRSAHPELCSSLLSCQRFCGSHTGERIAAEVLSVLDMYDIKQKVDYVITDNAANMRKALTTVLAYGDQEGEEELEEATVDNAELWEDIDENDQLEVNEAVAAHSSRERLSCLITRCTWLLVMD